MNLNCSLIVEYIINLIENVCTCTKMSSRSDNFWGVGEKTEIKSKHIVFTIDFTNFFYILQRFV